MTHTVAKLHPWSSVKGNMKILLRNMDPEDITVMLPYGLQLVHTFHHPHVLRCTAFYHSTKGNTFVTHIDSGAGLVMYSWTISGLDDLKVDCEKFHINTAINNLLSVPQHRVFIGYCSDMTLRVFSDILHKCTELSRTKTPTSVLCMAYNEDMDELVTGGHGTLQTWKMAHVELRDALTPGRPITCGITPEDWVCDIRVFQKQKQLVALCNEGIYMVDYVRNEELFHMPNWHATALTSFVWYRPLEYFITASMDGTIKVWNAIVFGQVHEFVGHYNRVTGLVTHPTDPLLISCSKDGTLRVWRLDTFQLTQRIDVGEEILGMRVAHGNQIYYQTLHDIKVWNFNQFHHLFTSIQSCIHKLARIKSTSIPSRILCAAEDGSVRLISTVSGSVLTIIYPMATYQVHTDIVYDPLSSRIYTALNSGDILVFDTSTNPCQAKELWVPPVPDESILCLALVKLDCALGFKESSTCESLIFGGHNSGQISLLEAKRSYMKDTVQGHCGAILALESSHGTLCGEPSIGNGDRLLSCGSDKMVNIWRLLKATEDEDMIGLQCLSSISCAVCPSHISMMSASLCLALPVKNSIVVYELLKTSRRKSLGFAEGDQGEVKVHKHLKDHDHTKPVNSLCSCPSLSVFASASGDGSVKIWDKTNTLVRELCFDPSLRGVCFANDHGDILVGFQNHISYVKVSSYLPYQYLERLVSCQFQDETKEEPLPFNPDHQLWFDIESLPVFPTNLTSRRRYVRRLSTFVQQHPEDLIKSLEVPSLLSSYLIDEHISHAELEPPPQMHHVSPKFDKMAEVKPARKHVCYKSEASEVPSKKLQNDEGSLAPEESDGQLPSTSITSTSDLAVHVSTSGSDVATQSPSPAPKNVWPVAPDGYIPNSVLRGLMGYRHDPTPVPESPWVLKMLPETMGDDLRAKSDLEQSYDNHEPFIWASSSEESLRLDSQIDLDDSSMGSRFALTPISPSTASRASGRLSVEDQKMKLKSLNLPKMLVIPTFEPTEALDKSSKGKKKKRKSRGINLTGGAARRKSRKQSLRLGGLEEEDGGDSQSSGYEDSDEDDLALLRRISQETWFPDGVSLDVESFVYALTRLLETTRDAQYRTVCNAVIDIYQEYKFPENLKRHVLSFFDERLSSPRAVVRANAVRVMTHLGANRQEVILKLIPKLVDDEEMVRQEAVTAVNELAGIKKKEDLADYLSKVGLLRVYRNEDATVLRDLSSRCASETPPEIKHLHTSLRNHIVTHQQCRARISSRRAQRQWGRTVIDKQGSGPEISGWDQDSPQSKNFVQDSRRRGRRIMKKQKKKVDRPVRKRQPTADGAIDEDGVQEEAVESLVEDEDMAYESESEFDYQSDENSTRVRFTDIPAHDNEDIKLTGRLQNRRQTIHSTMLEVKAEMLAREKETMVMRMNEKLKRHRERYAKLVSEMSERVVQRRRILPVNPFYWKYYNIGPDVSSRSTLSLEAQASNSDSAESQKDSKEMQIRSSISLKSEVGEDVVSVKRPCSPFSHKTGVSFRRSDVEGTESGFVEGTLTSTIKVTDPDDRTLETWGSSGVFTDSLLDGIQIKSLKPKVTDTWSREKTLKKTSSRPLTVANVKMHEDLITKPVKGEIQRQREAAAERLASAESAVESWRNFLREQGRWKSNRVAKSSSPLPCEKPRSVILPCIPTGTQLTPNGGNQRLLYSVSAGTDKSADIKNSSFSGYFGKSEFGKINMIWTNLSPITPSKKIVTTRPKVSLSDLPPVLPMGRRGATRGAADRNRREWLAAQLLFPSLVKLNAVRTFDRRTNQSVSGEERNQLYRWERPNAVVLPSIQSDLREVDKLTTWKETHGVEFKICNPLDGCECHPFVRSQPPPLCTPIVPRNSTISSTKLPPVSSKLKTSC